MNLYVFARVMQGLAKMAIKNGVVKDSRGTVSKYSWPVFGSLTWAAVMYLFRWHPEIIQVFYRSSWTNCIAEYEKFDEIFICEFRQLGFLEEFLVV
jgi:peroxisomal membrane protein 4